MSTRSTLAIAAALFAALSSSGARAADSCPPLTKMATADMHPMRGGTFTVSVRLKDRPSELLFDTGGAVRQINEPVFRELGVKSQESNIILKNVAGRSSQQSVTIPLTFGGVTVPGVQFQVGSAAVEGDNLTSGRGFDGIFTMDLFHGVDFDIDFGAKKLSLFKTDHCRGRVVYWQAPAIADVPFSFDGAGHIRLPVTLDGSRTEAILDTGASMTTVEQGLAKGRFNIDLNGPDVKQISQVRDGRPVYEHRFKSLAFEGVTISNPTMMILPNVMGRDEAVTGSHALRNTSASLPPVILGMDILHKLHIYVATKEGHLYITPAAAVAPAEPVQTAEAASSDAVPAAAPRASPDADPIHTDPIHTDPILMAASKQCRGGMFRTTIATAVREAADLHGQGKDAEAGERLAKERALPHLSEYESCLLDSAQKQLIP